MKTIKVIDLLKRMEKDIEIPKKIIYNFYTYEYHEEQNDYFNKNIGYLFDKYNVSGILHDTVVIIEDTPKEDKKIEKMEFCYEVADKMQNANNERFRDFINEIIDYINKLEKPSITISDINGNTINFDEKNKIM